MSGADTLRVQTYNILYDRSPVGGGSGAERWPLVVEGVRGAGADLVALQEVLPGRIAAIPRDLPEYRMAVSEPAGTDRAIAPLFAVAAVALTLVILRRRRHRDPAVHRGIARRVLGHGVTALLWAIVLGIPAAVAVGSWYVGGYTAVSERLVFLYRPEKLRLVETRTFWFSGTPTKPGTKGPFEFEPRLSCLGVFVREPGGETLAVLDVHPGHLPATHAASAALMRGILDARWNGAAQLLIGDFNAMENSERVQRLLAPAARPGGPPGFRDAWHEAPVREGPLGTFQLGGAAPRIDHVLVRGPVRALRVVTGGVTRGKLIASDHLAVTADLELSGPAAASDTLSR